MTRVYVPSSPARLRQLLVSGGIGPVPVTAYAVTDAVRSALREVGEEEWEYAALTAAAQGSLALLGDDEPPQRVVVVAEGSTVLPVAGDETGLVEVAEVIALRHVVAIHADSEEAAGDVAAARGARAAAERGDEAALAVVERCLDHELGWYATQEIGDLVDG